MVALHWVVLAFVTPLLPILHSLHCIILPHCHSAYSTWPTVHYGLNCIALSSVGLCDPSPACRLPGFRLQSIVATNPVLTISPHYHHHLHRHCADCHHHNVAGLHIINSSCHLCSHFLCHYHCEWFVKKNWSQSSQFSRLSFCFYLQLEESIITPLLITSRAVMVISWCVLGRIT